MARYKHPPNEPGAASGRYGARFRPSVVKPEASPLLRSGQLILRDKVRHDHVDRDNVLYL